MGRGKSGKTTAKTYALFHGSANTNIENFDMSLAGQNTRSGEHLLFFTDDRSVADEFSYERIEGNSMFFDTRGKKGKVYEVDVTMSNPLDMTNLSNKDVNNLISLSGGELNADMVKRFSKGNNQLLKSYIDLDKIKDYGYDGLIAKMDNQGHMEYAVVDSKQAKIKKK